MLKAIKMSKYGLLAVVLIPLLFTSFTFFPWHYGKTMIFQMLIEIIGFLYLLVILGAKEKESEISIKKFSWLDWSVLLFLVVITITAVTGDNFSNSFWGNQARANGVFTWWHFGLFYFLLVNILKENRKVWQNWMTFAVVVSLLACFTTFFPSILPVAWQSSSGGGIIGNRDFFSAYILLALGFDLYLLFALQNKWRWLLMLTAAVLFFAIFFFGSRATVIGFGVGIFGGLLFYLLQAPAGKYKKIIGIVSAVTLILASCAILLPLFFSQIKPLHRALDVRNWLGGTGATRLMAWNMVYQGFKQHPLLGNGMGNFELDFNKYYNPEFLKFGFTETVWDKPHNWFLELVSCTGVLGAISYLLIFVAAFYFLWHSCESVADNKELPARTLFVGILIGYFVQNLFLFETTNTLILFFALLACISSCYVSSVGRVSIPNFLLKLRFLLILLLSVVLLFLFLGFYFPTLKASYYVRQAELSSALFDWVENVDPALSGSVPFLGENAVFLAQQFTLFDKGGAVIKDPQIEKACLRIIAVLDQQSAKYPNNYSFPVWAGQVYSVLGEQFSDKYYTSAEDEFLRARQISPQRQETLFLLGRLYLLKKDFPKSIAIHQEAVALAPDINVSHWFLGLASVASGDVASGLKEIEKAEELGYALSGNQKLYVLDLYAQVKDYPRLVIEYQKLTQAEPDHLDWYVKLATAYALAGEKQKALEIAKELVRQDPTIQADVEKFIKQYKLE